MLRWRWFPRRAPQRQRSLCLLLSRTSRLWGLLGPTGVLAALRALGPTALCTRFWDQLLLLRQAFPDLHIEGRPALQLPLFPSRHGHPVTKDRMTATIVECARLLRSPLENADRTARVSGHTLRPTGAQGLARAGLDTWSIQLIGRWGSTAVTGYIQEATVSAAAARARSAFAARWG